ncbi:MAG: hypothetical protein ACFCBW_22470 [Candidatus Competibacterales bacterium]
MCRARLRDDNPLCGRCEADLSSVLAAEAVARRQLQRAIHCLARGDDTEALAAVIRAKALQQTPLARAVERFLRARRPHGGRYNP